MAPKTCFLLCLTLASVLDYSLSQDPTGYRYQFYAEDKTFANAEIHCETYSGNLASPEDPNAELMVQQALSSATPGAGVWIGAQSLDDSAYGIERLDLGSRIWRWVDTDMAVMGQGCYVLEDLGFPVSLSGDVTAPNCIQHCADSSNSYKYAALKVGTECYCINTFGANGPISTNTGNNYACDKKCDADQDNHYYCGGKEDDVYNVYKVDGAASIWFRNSPNNDATKNQQCGLLIKKWANDPYKLDDHDCDEEQQYICHGTSDYQCRINSGRPISTATGTGDLYCIFGTTTPRTWHEARDHCLSLEGDLVSLSSEAEFAYLDAELQSLSDTERSKTYWVGLAAHSWKFTNGKDVKYTNWEDRRPSEIKTGPKCVALNDDLRWEDHDCSTGHHFVCQFDVDECDTSPCDDNAECVNVPGGYECQCETGYEYDDDNDECEDINECDASPCVENANCNNNPGSYICSCKSGYVESGNACVEAIDECADSVENTCSEFAICTDLPIGYECQCRSGFTGDGETCTDTNECALPTLNNCALGATCTNTPGAFTCECDVGYQGNGVTCSDLDECSSPSTNRCPGTADCTNTAGSFICVCKPGFEGTGRSCTAVPTTASPTTAAPTTAAPMTTKASTTVAPATTKNTTASPTTSSAPTQAPTTQAANGDPTTGAVVTTQGAAAATTANSAGEQTTMGIVAPGAGGAGASTNNDGSSLSTAEIILIVACVILVIVIIGLIIFVVYYKRKNNTKNKVIGENTYDARSEAPMPYTGHLGDDYYYSGSDNGSMTGLVPNKNTRAGTYNTNTLNKNNVSIRSKGKITLDEKY